MAAYEARISNIPLNQISHILSYKLKDDNFLTWKSLLFPLLRRYRVDGFFDRSLACPPYIVENAVNPGYAAWHDDDTTLILWIQMSISESVISYVAGAQTSKDLWETIETRFARSSSTHSIQLRLKLQSIKLGSGTVSHFLSEIKKVTDELFAAGSRINDDELVVLILNGLSSDYNSFSTSIRIRNPPVISKELHNLLLSEEIVVQVKQKELLTEANSKAFVANARASSSSFRGSSRGYTQAPRASMPYLGKSYPSLSYYPRGFSQFQLHPVPNFSPNFSARTPGASTSTPPPVSDKICQICNRAGHFALECRHRLNFAYQNT